MYLAMRHWSAHAVLGCFSSLKLAKKAIEKEAALLAANVKIQTYQFEYYILETIPNQTGKDFEGPVIVRRYTLTKLRDEKTQTRWYATHRLATPATPAATLREFAYAILEGDPVACDAVRDILKI